MSYSRSFHRYSYAGNLLCPNTHKHWVYSLSSQTVTHIHQVSRGFILLRLVMMACVLKMSKRWHILRLLLTKNSYVNPKDNDGGIDERMKGWKFGE